MAKRKKKSKPVSNAASRKAAKGAAKKRTSSADRAKILAEMKSAGLTAKQAAKKYGISFWTIYGWRKRRGVAKRATRGKRGRRAGTGRSTGSLRDTLRPMIAHMVRAEIARLVGGGK